MVYEFLKQDTFDERTIELHLFPQTLHLSGLPMKLKEIKLKHDFCQTNPAMARRTTAPQII